MRSKRRGCRAFSKAEMRRLRVEWSILGRWAHPELMCSRHKPAGPHCGQERAQIVPIKFRHVCKTLQIGIALARIYRLPGAPQKESFQREKAPHEGLVTRA